MKKVILIIVIVFLALALVCGGVVAYGWAAAGPQNVPLPTLRVAQQQVFPAGYTWHVPVAFGLLHKEVAQAPTGNVAELGPQEEAQLAIVFPDDFENQLTLSLAGQTVWQGTAEQWAAYTLPQEGDYLLQVESLRPKQEGEAYGSLYYTLGFTYAPPPPPEPDQPTEALVSTSGGEVYQGDVLALQLTHPSADIQPQLQTPEGWSATAFMKNGPYTWVAYLPTSFYTEPGSYVATVQVEEQQWETPFTVLQTEFERQDMEIDLSDPLISEANSDAAYAEYNSTIPPLFYQADEEKYWNGPFVWPAESWLSTEYGFQRYTNGSPAGRPHGGLDIAADAGTPVVAPAAGRVLFADYLLNTGYTVVIEHGGGVKTLYYHMDSVTTQQDAKVEPGQQIGTVGSTGYSTGPHLHFEMRVLDIAVNPKLLLEGEGGLLYFDQEEEATDVQA